MANELSNAQVFLPDRSAVKPAVPNYSIDDFRTRLLNVNHVARLMSVDTATIRFIAGSPEIETRYIEHRDIIRLTFEDGGVQEFRVDSPTYVIAGDSDTTIRAEGMVSVLKDWVLKRKFTTGDRIDVTFTVLARDPAFYLALFIESLPSYVVSGGVTGLTAAQQAKAVSISFNGDTVHEALKKITQAIGAEWSFTYNSLNDNYELALTNRVEIAGTRFIGQDDAGALLAIDGRQKTLGREYASRIIPILSDVDGDLGLGAALFTVGGTAADEITLLNNPFPSDGWLIGQYVGNEIDGFFQVNDQVAGVLTVSNNPVVITQPTVRFATDAAGTPLYYLEPKAFSYGTLERVVHYRGSGFDNIFEVAGGDSTMTQVGLPDTAAGLEVVGSPTIGLVASEQHTRVGTTSQQVMGAKGEGVQTLELNPTGDYLSIWLTCSVLDGGLFMDVVDGNGVIHPTDIDRPFTLSEAPDVIAIQALKLDSVVNPIRVRILGSRDTNDFLIDGLTVVESASERPWEPVMGPSGLFKAVLAELEIRGDGAQTQIESKAIDAYLVSNLTHDQLVLGGQVTAKSSYFDIDTRIVEIARDYVTGITASVVTEKLDEDAAELLSQVKGDVIHWPVGNPGSSKPPIISISQTETALDVSFTLKVLSPGTNTELANYTIYVDHHFDTVSGLWSYLGPGAWESWEVTADAPHVATFRRPVIYQADRIINIYAVDEDIGTVSGQVTVRVPPIAFSLGIDTDQSGQDGVLNIQIQDHNLGLAVIETAVRSSPETAFGVWVDSSAVLANGYDQGVIGTDLVIDRQRTFALQESHNEIVKVRAGFNMPEGSVAYVEDSVTFDFNHIPDVHFDIELQYDGDANQYQAILHWRGDEDTDSIEFDYAGGGFVSSNGREGSVVISGGFTITPGNSFTIDARGKNDTAGISGQLWNKTFTTVSEVPAVRAERITGDTSALIGTIADSARRFYTDMVWNPIDDDTVTWDNGAGGSFTLTIEPLTEGGTADVYTILAGTTGEMLTGQTYYVYFDKNISTTQLQKSTLFSAIQGESKLLLGICKEAVVAGGGPVYVPVPGTLNAPRQISADEITTNVVKAVFITAAKLSALAVNTGILTVDDLLTMGAGGLITNAAGNFEIDENGFKVITDGVFAPDRAYVFDDGAGLIKGSIWYNETLDGIFEKGIVLDAGAVHMETNNKILLEVMDGAATGGKIHLLTGNKMIDIESGSNIFLRVDPSIGAEVRVQGALVGDTTEAAWQPPAMTQTERDAASLPNGSLIFNTTNGRMQARRGDGTWGDL